LAWQQGDRHVQHVLGELALVGEQLLGQPVGAVDGLLGGGQLAGKWHRDVRQLVCKRLQPGDYGIDPDPKRVDHGLLALAKGGQELVLQILRRRPRHSLRLLMMSPANYIKH
jgi:hypothetical protein